MLLAKLKSLSSPSALHSKNLKNVLLFLSICLFLSSTIFKVQALDDPYSQIRNAQKVTKPNLENYKDYSSAVDIFNISKYIGVPQGLTNEEVLLRLKSPTGQKPDGALGTASNIISQTFTPAASGVQYLAQVKDQLFGRPAYAQTNGGFSTLAPLLPIWRGFRNMVYLASSLLFIFVGFMIIFRVKINPQTVVSLQSALPQLITTLIFVTFSYAIAGLIIDLINFIQTLAIATLFSSWSWNGGSGPTPFGNNLFPPYLTPGSMPTIPNIMPGATLWQSFQKFINPFNFANLAAPNFATLFNLVSYLTPHIADQLFGGFIATIMFALIPQASALINLIVGIVILYLLLRLMFGLFRTYLHVVLKIIFAPIEIGLGAVPGIKMGFGSWLSDLFAYLMVFPITLLFLIIAAMLTSVSQNNLWVPGLLTITGTPSLSIIPMAIGLAALFLIAQLPELIPQAIFSLKPGALETAIGRGQTDFMGLPARGSALLHTVAGVRNDWTSLFGGRPRLPTGQAGGAQGQQNNPAQNARNTTQTHTQTNTPVTTTPPPTYT